MMNHQMNINNNINHNHNHNQSSFKGKCNTIIDNIQKSLRTQIIILTLIGWGVAMSIDRTLVDDYRLKSDDIHSNQPDLVRNYNDKVALSVLSVFETLLFGLGIGFFVAVGLKVFKIRNQMLRKRMIWCWACISFFMVSWWPHSTSHSLILVSSGDPVDNLIAIEISFHWTILFCSLTLSYFQYDLILLMFEVAMMKQKMETRKECNPLKMDWKYNFKYHAIVLLAVFFGFGMVFVFVYDPIDGMKPYQKFFFITFKIVDSTLLGCGFAFSYIALRIISLLPPSNGRKVAIISSFCIAALFFIGYGHPLAHTHAPVSMKSTVIIDYTIHLPIIILTTILAFYQFRMLELSTDSSSSLCMAAKLRNRPHKYSFPIRSLGIKSQAVTNIGNTFGGVDVGVSGSESKYTVTPDHDGSSAITTDEKLAMYSHRPTQPYPEDSVVQIQQKVAAGDKKEFNDEVEMVKVKKEEIIGATQFVSVDISMDNKINNNEAVEIDVEADISRNGGIAGGGDNNNNSDSSVEPNVEVIATVENTDANIEITELNEEDEEVLPTEETIDEFMHEI